MKYLTKSFVKAAMILTALLLICIAFSCQTQPKDMISDAEAKALVEGFMKFRNRGDVEAADMTFHPECVIKYPNLPEPIVGLDAYKEYDKMTRITFPDIQIIIDDYFVKGDKIYSYWTMTATHSGPMMTPMGEIAPTNRKVKVSGFAISQIVDGKIKEDMAYFDMFDMLMQLGFNLVSPDVSK